MIKKYSDNKLIALNMIWSMVAVAVNYAITFFMTSYVTNNAGAEAFGFVTLSNTLTAYIDVISVALNAFACRYISIAFHKGNIEEANKYFNSVIIADTVLSIFIIAIGTPAMLNLQHILNISKELVVDVKILFILTLFRYTITIIGTAFSVGTFITNRISLSERQKSVSFLVQGFFLIFLFGVFETKIWYVGIALLIASVYVFATNIHYTRILTSELRFNLSKFDTVAIKKLISLGIWNAINNFGNILNSGLDLILTNLMLSPFVMGEISIGKSLGTICNTLLESATNSFRPKLLQIYASGNIETLISEFKKAMKTTGMISNIIFTGFVVCGRDLFRLWLPTQNAEFLYIIAIIVLMSDIIIGVVKPLYYVFTLTKKLKVPCFITIATGIINVVSMYILIKHTSLGAYAVVLTTLVLNYVHFFDTPIYAAYCLKVKLTTFYPSIIEHFLTCFIQVFLMHWVFLRFPNCDNWLIFVLKCVMVGGGAIVINAIIILLEKYWNRRYEQA